MDDWTVLFDDASGTGLPRICGHFLESHGEAPAQDGEGWDE
jgi:hypothetical protein